MFNRPDPSSAEQKYDVQQSRTSGDIDSVVGSMMYVGVDGPWGRVGIQGGVRS